MILPVSFLSSVGLDDSQEASEDDEEDADDDKDHEDDQSSLAKLHWQLNIIYISCRLELNYIAINSWGDRKRENWILFTAHVP